MGASLRKGQYELDDNFVFGTRSPFAVRNQYLVGSFGVDQGDIQTVDSPIPNEDGTVFGEDFHGGMLVNFEINLWKKGQDALYDLAQIQSKWDLPRLRATPNEVTQLRMNKGSRTSVVYGRPRRFKAEYGAVELGWCPITADFQCVDELFYSDEVTVEEVGLAIVPSAGLSFPNTAPFVITQYAESQFVIEVGGTEPTWVTQVVQGPISDAELRVDGERWWKLTKPLNSSDTLSIDPRPWRRLSLLNGTMNWSNAYTPDSMMLRQFKLDPGEHEVVLFGVDPTLRGKVQLSWRDAQKTP